MVSSAQRISRSAARPVPRAEAVALQVYAAPGSSAAANSGPRQLVRETVSKLFALLYILPRDHD